MASASMESWRDEVRAKDKADRVSKLDFNHLLCELLCMIHRDGGQYINSHGVKVAYEDALNRVAYLNGLLDTAECDMQGNPQHEVWLAKLRKETP